MGAPTNRLVLVVDDVEDHRVICTQLLMSEGFRVITAETGEDALAMAMHLHPDIVLMDLTLPRMDGLEATRRLKMNHQTAHIPVIAVTGRAGDLGWGNLLDAGLDACVSKPFLPEELLGTVRQFMARVMPRGPEARLPD
jgi:CheY-like chemotaxis protein